MEVAFQEKLYDVKEMCNLSQEELEKILGGDVCNFLLATGGLIVSGVATVIGGAGMIVSGCK